MHMYFLYKWLKNYWLFVLKLHYILHVYQIVKKYFLDVDRSRWRLLSIIIDNRIMKIQVLSSPMTTFFNFSTSDICAHCMHMVKYIIDVATVIVWVEIWKLEILQGISTHAMTRVISTSADQPLGRTLDLNCNKWNLKF